MESLKQYFKKCVELTKSAEFDSTSYKERLERDMITVAILKLSMKYANNLDIN